ncbi:MAG TPA: alpha/beta hydrolase-fold protein [Kofleriaceae bacterium]|nr:alpha/beta hydrolase-fold protein [Kofleriaceae bacterium]
MRRNRDVASGTVHHLVIDSDVLVGNLLGDSPRREVDVYLPAGHDRGGPLPLLVDLVGFTGSGLSHTAWKNFGENVPERLDRLIGTGAMPPVAVAFPDCFTRLGGNQYINSAAMGRWEDFLIDEVLPEVEERFGCGGPGRRGVFGKSSGGYGTIVHAMRHPNVWSAAACHSGDMGFELLHGTDFPRVLRVLATHGGSIEAFIGSMESREKHKDDEIHVLMALAMAATYDPDPSAFLGIRLPVDLETCERLDERWRNWQLWDPLNMVEELGPGLRAMKGLYIDCGDIDQYHLVYGARRFHRALQRMDVPHRYEEFADDHSKVDFRMDVSLPFLAAALSEA